ncbi:hypothetical protein SDC9_201969 [bioreactor metagenome]|uniref:Uncharacterized protein n=1 Tax=bioreactor metagenome TaxID=1076179 RepID=A0A645IV52_9ZZZZ
MSNNSTPGFWQSLKQAFAYGLGGNLGWHVGNLLAGLVRKAWLLILVAPLPFALLSGNGNDQKRPPEKPPVVQKKAAGHTSSSTENKPPFDREKTRIWGLEILGSVGSLSFV